MNEEVNLSGNTTGGITGDAAGKAAGRIVGDVIPMVTTGILFVVILMLVVFSAISYQHAVEIQEGNNNARAILSYVITAVKANAANPVVTEERGGMPVLVIQEPSTGYEQMIFLSDGKVYETYQEAGTQPDPEDALLIGETDLFGMNWLQEDLLEISTDAGNSYVRVQTPDNTRQS